MDLNQPLFFGIFIVSFNQQRYYIYYFIAYYMGSILYHIIATNKHIISVVCCSQLLHLTTNGLQLYCMISFFSILFHLDQDTFDILSLHIVVYHKIEYACILHCSCKICAFLRYISRKLLPRINVLLIFSLSMVLGQDIKFCLTLSKIFHCLYGMNICKYPIDFRHVHFIVVTGLTKNPLVG